MNYIKQNFVNGMVLTADLLNHMEEGITAANSDLSDYYTKPQSDEKFQPKGDYLTTVPDEYVTEAELADKGYLTEHQALTDYAKKTEIPTTLPASDVKAWAKAANKPSYSKSEVGLGNVDNVKQYSESNPPPYPVTSINGKTGDVILSASDLGISDMDTKNTAGSTDTSSKIFLVGATSQAANPETYSHDTVYVDTNGYIYSNSQKVDPRINTTLVPYGTVIATNTDLNTTALLKVGNYYNSKNAEVSTLINCPTTFSFMMQVYSPLSTSLDDEASKTWVYRLRKIIDHKGNEWYQDVYSGATVNSFTYSDWKKIVKDIDITVNNPTLAYGSTSTLGTIGGKQLKVTMPATVTDAHINSLIDERLGVIENGSY